eukprot:jgi/Chrzof1/9465/Cz04g04040.t1
MPLMTQIMETYLSKWESASGPVPGAAEIKALTFDIILQVGVVPSAIFVGVWAAALPVVCGRGEIKERGAAAAEGILGSLILAVDDDGNRLTDEEITNNLLLLLFAGHDTSSVAMTQALANLHEVREAMEKLRGEQRDIVAKHGERLTAQTLKIMPYADAVIKETLCKESIVNALPRIATADFELGGYRVPAGSTVFVPLKYLSERDPRWVNEPADSPLAVAAFNPDRLTTEGKKQGWLMPFGAGMRFCLGAPLAMAEMKVFLAVLARRYSFTADTDTAWETVPHNWPLNGLPVTVEKVADPIGMSI